MNPSRQNIHYNREEHDYGVRVMRLQVQSRDNCSRAPCRCRCLGEQCVVLGGVNLLGIKIGLDPFHDFR